MAKDKREGYGKLLDYWVPPKEAGEPIGCLATTYTFDPELFEEECICRFLKMNTEVDEDTAAYIIEREEKLNNIRCATVLVDQSHSNKKHNPRWDLLPMRYQGTFHPKVTLLYWSGCIRLIVASANLSKSGYRENQEIFGLVDFELDEGKITAKDAPVQLLHAFDTYLREIILANSLSGETANKKVLDFLDSVKATTNQWSPLEGKIDKTRLILDSILIHPQSKSLFEQLTQIWNKYSNNLPYTAWVTSPFYDNPNAPNLPAEIIWTILRQRGEAKVCYLCPYEPTKTAGKKFLIKAPESLQYSIPKGRSSVVVNFRGIYTYTKDDNDKECIRSPHLKSIWLENDEWALYMIGSSNFTSAGIGLNKNRNYEANLVYIINRKANPSGYLNLKLSQVKSEELKLKDIEFSVKYTSEEDNEPGLPNLPLFFLSCEAYMDKGTCIRFSFDITQPIGLFSISDENGRIIFDQQYWASKGKPDIIEIPWTEKFFPYGFNVKFDDSILPAWWPVTVSDNSVLPTPDELKNLSFSELIDILSSSSPLYISLLKVLKARKKDIISHYGAEEILDPHKRVDTTGFILQRTRRMSSAINSLRERLCRPIYTKESLNWRLYGPVGVKAFCQALAKEIDKSHKSEELRNEEFLFFMAELVLEIGNLQIQTFSNCLPEDEIKDTIKTFLQDLYIEHKPLINRRNPSPIRNYARKSFNSILTP